MEIIEMVQDLFEVDEKYWLVHCISADFALGAGIATQFIRHLDTKKSLFEMYGKDYLKFTWNTFRAAGLYGDCLETPRTFNLITKTYCFEKPTYQSLQDALIALRGLCIEKNIRYLAMPRIGCGLDKLDWQKVHSLLEKVFQDLDIEILVCVRDRIQIDESKCAHMEGEW